MAGSALHPRSPCCVDPEVYGANLLVVKRIIGFTRTEMRESTVGRFEAGKYYL